MLLLWLHPVAVNVVITTEILNLVLVAALKEDAEKLERIYRRHERMIQDLGRILYH